MARVLSPVVLHIWTPAELTKTTQCGPTESSAAKNFAVVFHICVGWGTQTFPKVLGHNCKTNTIYINKSPISVISSFWSANQHDTAGMKLLTWTRVKWCVKTSSAAISPLHLLCAGSWQMQRLYDLTRSTLIIRSFIYNISLDGADVTVREDNLRQIWPIQFEQ